MTSPTTNIVVMTSPNGPHLEHLHTAVARHAEVERRHRDNHRLQAAAAAAARAEARDQAQGETTYTAGG